MRADRRRLGAAGRPRLVRLPRPQETTTDLTPEQIHAIGLAEIARITAAMDAVAREAGFASRADFIRELRTDPAYYAKTPGELMAAAALMAKTIDGKMPGLFGRLPRLRYGIRAIPAETAEGTTTAYYHPGSPAAGIAGTYYVNTSKLDQRPLWELPALTAHEAVPGHHHQIALQQELDLPPFRRYFSFFTAFTEGWGLYAERLGEEMGLYDTPAKKMGQLSYQAWRAARLVVDTGIHAHGLGQGAGDRLHAREHRALRRQYRCRGQPLHQLAGPGARLQVRRAEDPRAADPRGARAGREIRPAPLPRRGAGPGIGAARRARGPDRPTGSRREGAAACKPERSSLRHRTFVFSEAACYGTLAPHPPRPGRRSARGGGEHLRPGSR